MRQYGATFQALDDAAEEFYESDDDENQEDASERTDADGATEEEKKEDNGLHELQTLGQETEEGFERALPPLDNIKGTWSRQTFRN